MIDKPEQTDVNNGGTREHSDTPLTRDRSRPVRYELIDKDGNWAGSSLDPKWLVEQAKECWPDQEQDPDRTGKGWDVQVVEAE